MPISKDLKSLAKDHHEVRRPTDLVITAIPAGLSLSRLPSSPSETKIVGPVEVSSQELHALRDEVTRLKQEVQAMLSNRQISIDHLKELESARDRKLSTKRSVRKK